MPSCPDSSYLTPLTLIPALLTSSPFLIPSIFLLIFPCYCFLSPFLIPIFLPLALSNSSPTFLFLIFPAKGFYLQFITFSIWTWARLWLSWARLPWIQFGGCFIEFRGGSQLTSILSFRCPFWTFPFLLWPFRILFKNPSTQIWVYPRPPGTPSPFDSFPPFCFSTVRSPF